MMFVFLFLAQVSFADDTVYKITLKDQKIVPEKIEVVAGESFWLEIDNTDNSSEEIESNSLKIEKIIPPRRQIKVKVKALKEGVYDLFGEFHPKTSRAEIIAKPKAVAP